jgi:hypothetical protein
LVQVLGLPHWPLELHVCTALPEHCTDPGLHDPEHAPATQAELAQLAAEPQLHVGSHVCTPFPEHCVSPGVHDPVHDPFTHARFVQTDGALH